MGINYVGVFLRSGISAVEEMNAEVVLLEGLNNKAWYSYSMHYVCRWVSMSREQVIDIVMRINESPACIDKINIFSFGGVEYLGLESRRLDYEYDKQMGTNPVEHYIAMGLYS
jgi:homoserine trans-succinylase